MLDRLIDFLIQVLDLFRFFHVLPSYQKGVLLRFGKFKRLLDPGLIFYVPFGIDAVLTENVVFENLHVGPQSLTTKDGIGVVTSVVVGFTVSDVKVFLLEVEGRNNVIVDSTYGAVADFFVKRTWEELQNIDVANELSKTVRRQAKKYGVEIVSVQLCDFTRCKSIRLVGTVKV